MERMHVGGLSVAGILHEFIEQEALPGTGTGVAPGAFWSGLGALVRDLGPRNRSLLSLRDELPVALWTPSVAVGPRQRAPDLSRGIRSRGPAVWIVILNRLEVAPGKFRHGFLRLRQVGGRLRDSRPDGRESPRCR